MKTAEASTVKAGWLVVVVMVASCADGSAPTSDVSAAESTVSVETRTTAPATTTTAPRVCPPPPYEIGSLPARVSASQVPAENITIDETTSVPGASSTIWVDDDGGLALALVRGTLPVAEWPGERGEVTIDGARAVVGPLEDGSWVAGWFEEPGERCDLYTLVFFPPVDPAEVQAALASMDRTAG